MVYKPVKVISNERYVIGESGDSQLVESQTQATRQDFREPNKTNF